jgi:hypothetical protein
VSRLEEKVKRESIQKAAGNLKVVIAGLTSLREKVLDSTTLDVTVGGLVETLRLLQDLEIQEIVKSRDKKAGTLETLRDIIRGWAEEGQRQLQAPQREGTPPVTTITIKDRMDKFKGMLELIDQALKED